MENESEITYERKSPIHTCECGTKYIRICSLQIECNKCARPYWEYILRKYRQEHSKRKMTTITITGRTYPLATCPKEINGIRCNTAMNPVRLEKEDEEDIMCQGCEIRSLIKRRELLEIFR